MLYHWYREIRTYFAIALLLCGAIVAVQLSSCLDVGLGFRQPPAVPQQQGQPATQPAPVAPAPASAATQPSTIQPGAAQAVAVPAGAAPAVAAPAPATADVRAQLWEQNSRLSEAAIYASKALKEVVTWQSDVEPLLGRTVGEAAPEGSELAKSFERLNFVMGKERTGAEELGDASTRIDTLRRKIDGSMKQPHPTALTDDEVDEISRLHATCKKANEDWERDVKQALAIKRVFDLETETPAKSTTPPTFGDEMDEVEAKSDVSRVDEEMKVAEEREAEKKALAIEIEKQKFEQEQREAELLAKATLPEVKALLAPFLEPRTIQPSLSGRFSIKWVRTYDKEPMSFGKLVNIGVLDDSVLGLQKLALVGGNRDLPEPKWSIASQPNNWSPGDEERLKRAQQMLRDYGSVLVKAKWLSQ